MVDVGERIKKARQAAGLTQAELAKKINFSKSFIGDIERNRHSSNISTLQIIAEALHVDVAEFVGNGVTLQETGLTNDEIHWLMVYRSLSDDSKRLTTAMMSKLAPPKSARYSTSISSPIRTHKAALGG